VQNKAKFPRTFYKSKISSNFKKNYQSANVSMDEAEQLHETSGVFPNLPEQEKRGNHNLSMNDPNYV